MILKKIIIFYPSFEKGGVENILINLLKFFLKKKINITLISSNFKHPSIKKNKYFKLKNVNNKINLINNRISKSLFSLKILANELRKSEKKNTIVFSLQSSSLSIVLSKYFNFKIVVRNAEDPIYSTFFKENKFFSVIVLLLKIITYNFADGVITNSKGSKNSLSKIIFRKISMDFIYNPYLKNIKKRNKFKKKNYILSVGRLTKQKDFQNLINSFNLIYKKIPNYKLIIVGNGELRTELKNLIFKLKLKEKIILTGWKKNLDNYYQRATLFVLPSLYEGLGNVVIDAVNFEIPTIVTNCKSGPNEIILNNKGGFIVPKSNSKKLSNKILYVINNYVSAKKKVFYAKKNINRFLCEKNSTKYFNFIKKTFDEY